MGREAKKELNRPFVPLAVGDSEHKPVLPAAKLHMPRSPHHLVPRPRRLAQSQAAVLAEDPICLHNRGHNLSSKRIAVGSFQGRGFRPGQVLLPGGEENQTESVNQFEAVDTCILESTNAVRA